ncbi:MAG: T9SS type A sorting domain-containing protein [Flavipsychrobacter sp.]
MKKALYTLLLLAFFAPYANASHLAGGELRYEYNGTNYTVFLTLYGDCTGVNMPTFVIVDVASASKSLSAQLTLPQTALEIVTPPCPTAPTKCHSSSSVIPGYRVAKYKATINIPNVLAADWKFSVSLSARNTSNNLASGGNLYLEATLNNVNGHNSTPYIPNTPSFYITTSTTPTVVPLQTIDPDGDSIVYDRVAPKLSATSNATYSAGGFSPTNPFGANGLYSINAANQTYSVRGGMQGFFAMAFKVREYRNGNLIGSYIRDFGIAVLAASSNNVITYPMISASSTTTVYSCPSSMDTAYTWFIDPTSTDTVFVEVDTPVIAGWTFNNSTMAGSPTGSATVWWSAPANLNPLNLPFFYIDLKVKDNGCPMTGFATYAILVKTRQCSADSVWPGDANSDNVVNLLDPLAVALSYNSIGPSRPNASNNWVAQYAPDWGSNIPLTSVNRKHADCNGDSIVNLSDLAPIVANYGLTHPKGNSANKITGAPEIFFDLSSTPLVAGFNVSVPIKMGTSGNQMKDIYGFAARVKLVTSVPLSPIAINTATSWMGNSTNTLNFNKDISNTVVDWAYARIDHQNVSGDGTIATVDFTIPTSVIGGESIVFSFENPILIDKDGKPITLYNMSDTTGIIQIQQSVANVAGAVSNAYVVPNPSGNTASLHLQLAEQDELVVNVVDVTGKLIWTESRMVDAGNNQIALPATQIASGVYFIHIQGAGGHDYKVKWVKQ